MDNPLAQIAINQAIAGHWSEAVATNKKIIKNNKSDIDALNRLARAQKELGEIKSAIETAGSVLKIDPDNTIATRSIAKWKGVKAASSDIRPSGVTPATFLEDPGKTKLIDLIHPGASGVLANLDCGDDVSFLVHPHRVSVVTQEGKYIGRLPDDMAARIGKLIRSGSEYQVLIKSVDGNKIKIFVRELKNNGAVTSFPGERVEYVSFTPPELVHAKTTTDTEETPSSD